MIKFNTLLIFFITSFVFTTSLKAQNDSIEVEKLYVFSIQNLRVDPKKSYENLEKALVIINDSILTKNKNNRHFLLRKANILDRLSYNYRRTTDYANSLKLLQESLTIKERINETQSLSLTYCYFGSLYVKKKDSTKTLSFFNKAMDAAKQYNHDNIPYVMNSYSNYYMVYKDFEKAKVYAQKAYKFSDSIHNFREKVYSLTLLSRYYVRIKDFKTSIQYSLKALKVAAEINDKVFIEVSNKELGYAYRKLGQPKKALDYYLKSLELTKAFGFSNRLANRYLSVSNAYTDLNQHENAFSYYRLYKRQQIKNLNIKNIREFAELDAKYTYDKQKTIDSLQLVEKQKINEAQLIEKASVRFWKFTSIFIGLVGITIVTAVIILRKRREQIKLSRLKNEILEKEIAYKKKDLKRFALNITTTKEWASDLVNKIQTINSILGENSIKELKELESDIKNKVRLNTTKEEFHDKIELLSSSFYENLNSKFPNLTKTEIRFCSLIRLDMDTKQIATLQNITPSSVKRSKNRLRKKLNLSPNDDFYTFLSKF